jgi:hypothetical protein
MRALILIAASLTLVACSHNDQTDKSQNVDENLTAENIVSNDVTAIDAVTGEAANMAGESDINDIGASNILAEGNMSSPTKAATPRRSPSPPPSSTTTTNSASNASSNATD